VLGLYYNTFPVFITGALRTIFDERSQIAVWKDFESLEDYYYAIEGQDFYLLDLSLIKAFDLDFSLLNKRMKFGKIKGDLCLMDASEVEKLDVLLRKDYSRAFIFVMDNNRNLVSTIVYFVVRKQKILEFLNAR